MANKTALAVLGAACTVLATLSPALSAGPASFLHNFGNSSGVRYLLAGQRTLAPFAHVRFCHASPSECEPGKGPSQVELTGAKFAELSKINTSVNSQIQPFTPPGIETWVVAPKRGNCHDYAVTKRHDLIAKGWPAGALRLAIVYTPSREGHLVLVVKTSAGDLVLDNLHEDIKLWNDTDLEWVEIQSTDDPHVWYKL